jgi:hypothetical protein
MNTSENCLIDIAILRLIVGFLGEQNQYGWWSSSFLNSESVAFLSPVFSRSCLLAQIHGVIAAACEIHDQRIGVGDVFHLFRLPEDIEVRLQKLYRSDELNMHVREVLQSRDTALTQLDEISQSIDRSEVGPFLLADKDSVRDSHIWSVNAAYYSSGFKHGSEVYPYFGGHR